MRTPVKEPVATSARAGIAFPGKTDPKPPKVNLIKEQILDGIEDAVAQRLPSILARAADGTILNEDLLPIERAARVWRQDMQKHLGGSKNMTAPQKAMLTATCATWLMLSTID